MNTINSIDESLYHPEAVSAKTRHAVDPRCEHAVALARFGRQDLIVRKVIIMLEANLKTQLQGYLERHRAVQSWCSKPKSVRHAVSCPSHSNVLRGRGGQRARAQVEIPVAARLPQLGFSEGTGREGRVAD